MKNIKTKLLLKTAIIFMALILTAVQAYIFYRLFTANKADIILLAISAGIFLLSIVLCVLFTFKNIKNFQGRSDSDSLEEHRRFELQYYELAKSHRQEIATLKHEVANQLQVATNLLKSQAIDDKKKGAALLMDIKYQNSVNLEVVYCDNTIINTIMVVKAKIAKAFGIKTRSEITADDSLAISKLDLCSIFGNLMDNATEAAKGAKIKFIEIKAAELSGFFIVKIKNSKSNAIKKVNNEIVTQKADEKNHGKGIRLLKRIAEKYEGKIVFEYDDETFTATLTLKLDNSNE